MFKPCCMVALVCLTLCGTAVVDIIHVPGDFPTIQETIDAAMDGDEVEVHLGTYKETINLLGKVITVRSSEGPEVMIIDGTGLVDLAAQLPEGAPGPVTCDIEANVVLDQIGLDPAASLSGPIYASQFFPDIPAFDIAALDDFVVPAGGDVTLACVDVTMAGGGDNFTTIDNVQSWSVQIYSTPQAAAQSLTGDAASLTNVQASVTDLGGGFRLFLINLDLSGAGIILPPGTYWIALIPTMEFGCCGQTFIAGSTIGANPNAYQANPGGGFNLPGNLQQIDPLENLAYRVVAEQVRPDPCPWDLDDSGSVGILDLLSLLAAWGTDPGGPPDFDGSGTVDIFDLLTLIANWGPCP